MKWRGVGGAWVVVVWMVVATAAVNPLIAASPAGATGSRSGATPAAAPPRAAVLADKASCQVEAVPEGQRTSVPIRVTRILLITVVEVTVCIDGQGPFPFLVDSGATGTMITDRLAQALHLSSHGKAQKGFGASCTSTYRLVAVANWSIGHVGLAPQSLSTASVPGKASQGIDGLLGSDVLSRFGAVTVDYTHSKLELPGPEGAPLANGMVRGPTATPTPPVLVAGQPTPNQVPIDVLAADGQVLATVPVRFGTRPPVAWVVDTGSSLSGVATTAVHRLHLVALVGHVPLSTVGCQASVSFAKSGRWSVGGTRLDPQDLVALRLPGVSAHGIEGLLGSDVFSRFRQITIDYAGGRLLLG